MIYDEYKNEITGLEMKNISFIDSLLSKTDTNVTNFKIEEFEERKCTYLILAGQSVKQKAYNCNICDPNKKEKYVKIVILPVTKNVVLVMQLFCLMIIIKILKTLRFKVN